jgi:hypothetical protein
MWVSLAPRTAHRAARAGLATLAAGTAAGCSVWAGRRASCSAATLPGNPLWPSGVRPEIVEAYVDEILSDPSINIVAIPDAIERQIYVSTVKLTLNAVYCSIAKLHGLDFLGHCFQLKRVPQASAATTAGGRVDGGGIDESELELIASKLLENNLVNHSFVPDAIEHQVYANCLKLIFRVLDSLADSLSIRICGHEITLGFEPMARRLATERAGQRVASRIDSTPTQIDPELLEALARETVGGRGAIDAFTVQLHATLFSLIAGIVDDILQHTELAVLSEQVILKLVPTSPQQLLGDDATGSDTPSNVADAEAEIARLRAEVAAAHRREWMAEWAALLAAASTAYAYSTRN